jgi:hypothetical protein
MAANGASKQCRAALQLFLTGAGMTDRNSPYGIDNLFADLTKSVDAIAMDEQNVTSVNEDESLAGDAPLVRLTKKPTMVPVPRPHNAAALARSAFASSSLPVMNVHAKTRELEVRGH